MRTDLTTTIWDTSLTEKLNHLNSIGLHRELKPIEHATEPLLTYNGKTMVNLSANNYLGLANHPHILQAMREQNGTGSASSRLILGHDLRTEELERELAQYKKTEAALLFANGYMMNVGVLSSLLEPCDAVFSDQYNHASIVDGIKLSGATHYRYRHGNLEHLELLLKKATAKGTKRKLIVTETVFSMDGDVAPLADIIYLKNKYGAALITDDAHGDGVFGEQGEGMLHELGLEHEADLQMGTFSKAYGVYGAYVAGNKRWIDYLIHTCRSLIYTTALPPSIVAGIHRAHQLVKEGRPLRQTLLEKSNAFRRGLQEAGFNVLGSTHIIPLLIGDEISHENKKRFRGDPCLLNTSMGDQNYTSLSSEEKALDFSKRLLEENIYAVAIRPPTVPQGSSRIRFTLMATHTKQVLEKTLATIISLRNEEKP